jgi:Spy/CpxP family protein refolding chaperone
MTATVKRIILGVGASVIALGVTAGVYASAQNTSQDPPPFSGAPGSGGPGRFGGPGGPGGPGRFGGPGGPMGMLPMLGPKLGLTDAQKDQIRTIAQSHQDEWKALADRSRTAHQALNDAIDADQLDEALVRSKSAEAGVVEADMAVARARVRGEVFQILTADQKTQLKAMQAAMKNRMKGQQHARRERRSGLLERLGL